MKSVGLILVFVLLAHAQCGASCIAVETHVVQPSCHQHNQASPSQNHYKEGPCGQTQVIESKAATSKCILQWSPAGFIVPCFSLPSGDVSDGLELNVTVRGGPDIPGLAPVLRI
jgi:hypothetical protein